MSGPSGTDPPGTGRDGAARARARREPAAAVVGALVAGGLALVAGGQPWARVVTERPAPLPPVESVLQGGDVAPLVPAGGLLLLAAAGALLAVRGLARLGVGMLVAAAAAVLAWSGLRALLWGVEAGAPEVAESSVAVAWPALALAAGLLGLAVAALVVARGRGWAGMGSRYERSGPGARRAADPDRSRDAWAELDRGHDPTDDAPTTR